MILMCTYKILAKFMCTYKIPAKMNDKGDNVCILIKSNIQIIHIDTPSVILNSTESWCLKTLKLKTK